MKAIMKNMKEQNQMNPQRSPGMGSDAGEDEEEEEENMS